MFVSYSFVGADTESEKKIQLLNTLLTFINRKLFDICFISVDLPIGCTLQRDMLPRLTSCSKNRNDVTSSTLTQAPLGESQAQ